MRQAKRGSGWRPGALLGKALLGLLLVGVGQTDNKKPLDAPGSDPSKTNFPQLLDATSPAGKPLNLLLTRAELQAIVRNYEFKTGEVLTGPFDEDEVIVTAPHELAPMRDVSQDSAGGLFWAIMHPKDAWRIFLPTPPKGRTQEAERPAPDPR